MKKLVFILLVLFASNSFASEAVDHYQDLMNQGNAAYKNNAYEEALSFYAQIEMADFSSAMLCYNMGNAHFKLGQNTDAIWYYERALKQSPGDPDILFNLTLANGQITDKIEAIPELGIVAFKNDLIASNSAGWSTAFYLFWILATVALVIFVMNDSSKLKKLAFTLASVFFVVGLFALWATISANNMAADHSSAIVFSSSVAVKSEPSEASQDLFVIHEGIKVTIVQESNDWAEITLADGKQGWLGLGLLKKI